MFLTTPIDTRAAARAETGIPRARLLALMDDWVEHGWIRQLDAVFARFLWSEAPDAPPLLILAALLASHQLGHGHACLDIGAALADPETTLALPPEGADATSPDVLGRTPAALLAHVTPAQWLAALDVPALVGRGPGGTPLVLVEQRLYLRRCWQYEQDINAGIVARMSRLAALQADIDAARLRGMLAALFPPMPAGSAVSPANWQKIACAAAARSAFTIITGGPGTGKTTTVVKVLAILQALALDGRTAGGRAPAAPGAAPRPLRIRLAAPTGKAAARLSESIAGAVSRLPMEGIPAGDAIRQAIPTRVSTLHRLLGSRPGSRKFRHDASRPLALDVLVVDEASMIDLETMAALLQAMPPGGRLILLGDKDQLASVEAGAVLADLCREAHAGRYTPATRDWLEQVTGERLPDALVDPDGTALDQAIVMLRHSHRFAADSGIGRLATAVNAGDRAAVSRFWRQNHAGVTRLTGADCGRDLPALALNGQARMELELAAGVDAEDLADGSHDAQGPHGYAYYLRTMRARMPAPGADASALDEWARAVLRAHGAFQLLTTLRHGDWGVAGLNRRIARLLHDRGLIEATEGWYAGRPVLVTRNDYALGLMNGDIGITLALPQSDDRPPVLRVAFPMTDGSGRIKWVLPSRLQSVETVFALTVHKSQGSEFDHAAVVLPERLSPILTRELLYTGITRARTFLTLLSPGGEHVLEQAVARQVRRASGLLA
ncbi:exodeoxyribonuclease V subunit alpha [Bordetella genomosp. 9]|uniref:RecBCD enzyme subunit RecD n=1 Tax=Bordetella genomosp. 9 TaxID=1416803 RepID=A0A1W6YVB5_9BORD|nr:exodeoxyribonuclease V subunit alpha [Bordetella genomosp. 9]ARP84951.1 exodeoxyribonuclease V subunit alpha [Bordetella genomosp. 9]